MAVSTRQEVTVEDVRHTLSDALGPRFRVTVTSDSTLSVGRTGVIPAHVHIQRAGGETTFSVRTTGLIVSRIAQVVTIYPRVRRALMEAYAQTSSAAR